jgi:CBS-domain-containing membrane protein
MSSEVTYAFEDEDIERTAQLMKDKRLRRVLIVARNKRLVGIVSLGDLAVEQQGRSSDVLEQISEAPPNK